MCSSCAASDQRSGAAAGCGSSTIISVSRRVISGWSIYCLPDFIARVVQIPVQFAAGLLRALFCVMQRLAAIVPELFGAAPRVLTGLTGLFTCAILIRPGASPQNRCEEDNRCISHGRRAVQILCQVKVRPVVVCEKKLLYEKKPAGWNYTGGQGDSGRVTSEMKKL